VEVRPLMVRDAEGLLALFEVLGWAPTATAPPSGSPGCSPIPTTTDGCARPGHGRVPDRAAQLDGAGRRAVAELTGLAVLPDVAGTGVGSRLLAEFETWAIDAGAWRLKITSGDHRPDAHAFYERRGYAHSGIRLHKLIRDEP
jgi:GNAT superfamily N-acetyltransferase